MKSAHSGSRRILVIDDDPASCELVAYFLKSLGYRVAIAADGLRAVNMDLEDDIELVILDGHMPGLDGVEVLARLRVSDPAQRVKVLVLTGDASARMRTDFESASVDGFLTKPVDRDDLRSEVARLLPGEAQTETRLIRLVREQGYDQPFDYVILDPRKNLERN
ncbi:MAG TPA: response regulator [Candidatus Dormibacteraeota bacterium]|nr:response regulator [Candidatus Dormibacteraeota bacterium]